MEVRTAASPRDVKHYTTDRLREEFLIQDLFQADRIRLVYSHIDRIITGAAVPVKERLELTAGEELRAEYFLQRRELVHPFRVRIQGIHLHLGNVRGEPGLRRYGQYREQRPAVTQAGPGAESAGNRTENRSDNRIENKNKKKDQEKDQRKIRKRAGKGENENG